MASITKNVTKELNDIEDAIRQIALNIATGGSGGGSSGGESSGGTVVTISGANYRGSVNTYNDLPSVGVVVGDIWNIKTENTAYGIKANDNVIWNGVDWDNLSGTLLVKAATDQITGIMKLYPTTGANTDGTITQAAITDALNGKLNTSDLWVE